MEYPRSSTSCKSYQETELQQSLHGYPGATSQKYGYLHTGKKIKLVPVSLTGHINGTHFLLHYSLGDFFKQCNGTGSIPGTNCQMNGFDTVPPICGASGGSTDCGVKYPQYTNVPKRDPALLGFGKAVRLGRPDVRIEH